jgi:hypothetical protein
MSQRGLTTAWKEQHQNRIDALVAQVERYGQSGAASTTRTPRRAGTSSRPGQGVRVTSRDGVRVFELKGGGKWHGRRVERVERGAA